MLPGSNKKISARSVLSCKQQISLQYTKKTGLNCHGQGIILLVIR